MMCPRCKGEMRVKDYELPKINKDGKMPCPTCNGDGTLTKEEYKEWKGSDE